MDTTELNERLVGVGNKIREKGWRSASINIYVSYLAILDRPTGPLDPMISYQSSIKSSTRDRYGSPTSHEFVRDAYDVKSIEEAVEKLEAAADNMPSMQDESERINQARAKLSDDEKRLLGVQ